MILTAYVLLALGVSFLCSIAEAVLLSIPPSYIEGLKEKRPGRAALIKRLKQDDLDRSLAAILTLNTIAHTIGAIGAGAKATLVFGSAWFGLFSSVMTLMILFLSEIIPKTIGAVYWTRLVGPVSLFIRGLILLLYPIVWISEKTTRFISRGKALHIFTRDEFVAMASAGEKTGELAQKESRMIKNLLRFESLKVSDIMTPRTVVSAFSEETATADALALMVQAPFSRFPVYRNGLDNITGFVLKQDILAHAARNEEGVQLKMLKRDIIPVPDSVPLTRLLETFLTHRTHMAIVVNEHGGTDGLVTLEDLIETLMGMEIMDETDSVEDMRVLARKQWIKRAKAAGVAPELFTRPPDT